MYSYYFSHLSQPRLLFVCKMKNKWEREGQKTIFHNKWGFIKLFLLVYYTYWIYCTDVRSKTTSIKNK